MIGAGIGPRVSASAGEDVGSKGGGALFSPPLSSSHLSISSREENGRFPSNATISSLQSKQRLLRI